MLKHIFLALTFLLKLHIISSQLQYVQFFSLSNCLGESPVNNFTAPGTHQMTANWTSFKTVGLWRVSNCPTADIRDCPQEVQPTLEQCSNQLFLNGTYARFVRYGVANQTGNSLTIYPNPYLYGTPLQISSDRNATDFNATSYYFVGNDSWTVFEETGFQGSETCLFPNSQIIEDGYGITYVANEFKVLGSVCRGCPCASQSTEEPETSPNSGATSPNLPESSTNQQETSPNPPETSSNQPETSPISGDTSTNQPETSTDNMETSPNPINQTTNATISSESTRNTTPGRSGANFIQKFPFAFLFMSFFISIVLNKLF